MSSVENVVARSVVSPVARTVDDGIDGGLTLSQVVADAVGYWPLQDDAASTVVVDAGTGANNGSLIGGKNTADATVTGPGSVLSKSLYFDGLSDYITFGDSLDTVWAGDSKQFSLAAYVKPDAVLTSAGFLTKFNPTGDNRQFLFRISTGSKVQFFWYRETGVANSYTSFIGSTAITNTAKWYAVVITFDGTQVNYEDRPKIYIDGIDDAAIKSLDLNFNDAYYIGDKTAPLLSGATNAVADFKGAIAGLAVWDRLLSQTEILAYSSLAG